MQNTFRLTVLPVDLRSSRFWPTVFSTLALWRHRSRSRRQLAALGDRELADIGVSRAEQWAECGKPFWQ